MEKYFNIPAILCAGIALTFFWIGQTDVTFVLGAVGCVLWFVGLRFRLKKATALRANKNL